MNVENRGANLQGNDAPDPVADAVMHGLLAALAARERRAAYPPARSTRERRLYPVAAAVFLALTVSVLFLLVDRLPSAHAESVMSMAIAHSASPGTRVYRAMIDPEGDGLGRRAIEGLVFLEGGPASRMASEFRVGPLQGEVRFGMDSEGAWVQTPMGIRRGPDGAPVLTDWLGGIDDRVLRIDKILERCSAGCDISLVPAEGLSWRLRAVRRSGETAPIVEAEFVVRQDDGAVISAWLVIESLGGARAEIILELAPDIVATDADLSP
jgi:hypothetical protein